MAWIEKSIEIQKDPLNLEILADYYVEKNETERATKTYIQAIEAGKEQNFWFDSSDLQAKLWNLK